VDRHKLGAVPPPERAVTRPHLVAPDGDNWIALSERPLPVDQAWAWAVVPRCGGVVTFCGTVRDHSEGRPQVTGLEYEAYVEQVGPRLEHVAATARSRWPEIGRLALWHRVGPLVVGEVSVVVAVSTPHREEAFDAARYGIDTLKRSVPIWKRETWAGGSDWSRCTHAIEDTIAPAVGPAVGPSR
jgi:molybdopterin synthase catalytic subunit